MIIRKDCGENISNRDNLESVHLKPIWVVSPSLPMTLHSEHSLKFENYTFVNHTKSYLEYTHKVQVSLPVFLANI